VRGDLVPEELGQFRDRRPGEIRPQAQKAASLAHLGAAEPDDLASLVVFLAGPGSARLTGQAISVNGGISAA
jgi:NAD(P)-dependent dehydrogenase (short-subunit alcohol dehydrogenase family)